MATIETRVEAKRGCGYRKPGGLYLVGGRLAKACNKFPIELSVCPCCQQGVKQSRGMSFISGLLINNAPCKSPIGCSSSCNSFLNESEYGLLWVGEAFYKTPSDFTKEARLQGISKRIGQIPRKLVVGKTVVLLAHPKAIVNIDTDNKTNPVTYKKGVFAAFIPERIEYVVKGTESEEELNSLEKRGFTLVKVIKDTEAQTTLA